MLKCAGQNGQILWAREFQGPSTYESVWDMVLDPAGLPVVAAASNGVGTQADFAVGPVDEPVGVIKGKHAALSFSGYRDVVRALRLRWAETAHAEPRV